MNKENIKKEIEDYLKVLRDDLREKKVGNDYLGAYRLLNNAFDLHSLEVKIAVVEDILEYFK